MHILRLSEKMIFSRAIERDRYVEENGMFDLARLPLVRTIWLHQRAEIDDQVISHEHAQYLRDKYLWHKDQQTL